MLLAKELEAHHLSAKSDSLLVTGQVTDEYQAKDPQLASYLRYVNILKDAFYTFDLVHVHKEQNSRADLLSKLASSGKKGRQRSMIQETLKSPRTTAWGLHEDDHFENCMRYPAILALCGLHGIYLSTLQDLFKFKIYNTNNQGFVFIK